KSRRRKVRIRSFSGCSNIEPSKADSGVVAGSAIELLCLRPDTHVNALAHKASGEAPSLRYCACSAATCGPSAARSPSLTMTSSADRSRAARLACASGIARAQAGPLQAFRAANHQYPVVAAERASLDKKRNDVELIRAVRLRCQLLRARPDRRMQQGFECAPQAGILEHHAAQRRSVQVPIGAANPRSEAVEQLRQQ